MKNTNISPVTTYGQIEICKTKPNKTKARMRSSFSQEIDSILQLLGPHGAHSIRIISNVRPATTVSNLCTRLTHKQHLL